MEVFKILVLVALIGLLLFWCSQFIGLMLMREADFPYKHDKILWFIAFLVLPLLAPFVFVFWKQARETTHAAAVLDRLNKRDQGE
jgi:hypothetical protein